MPAFMSKVHADGIYRRLLTLLDFVTVSLYLHKTSICHSIVSAIKVVTHIYFKKNSRKLFNLSKCHLWHNIRSSSYW